MMSFPLRSSALTLLSAAMLVFAAASPANAADAPPRSEAPQSGITLLAKPSEMLRAPPLMWEPVLKQISAAVADEGRQVDSLSKPAQIELAIHQTVLAQAKRDWPGVFAGVKRTRQLQDSESGRQTAGLLNEVLARQVVDKGDAAWLQRHLRDRVLAMPWADVEPSIRMLRDQLAGAQVEAIDAFVTKRMDLNAGMTRNNGSLGFVMQLLGVRFQLLEVMPRRDALLAGLDEAIAQRGVAAASAAGK